MYQSDQKAESDEDGEGQAATTGACRVMIADVKGAPR